MKIFPSESNITALIFEELVSPSERGIWFAGKNRQ